jgi:TolB-like protein/tetratricopeptide (TPR) repeat protein
LYFIPQRFLPAAHGRNVSDASTNKSIAVLYFDNMSGDPTQEYLSDGLTEEIITRLTKIDGLRVISRTSVSVYKGQRKNLKQIAKDLNVSAILEGSVRKSGNKLRVVAQLIDASTDEHLWADTYDREIDDVFVVQAQIAEVIADRFQIVMTPEVNIKVHEIATKSSEAYDHYLKARHIAFNQYYYIYDTIEFKRAEKLYKKAINLDSTFALAYAGLADLYDASLGRPEFTPERDSLRHTLSWKAYQLDPNSGFVNNVRVWSLLNRNVKLVDSALYHARKAIRLEPNDYYNWQTMGDVLNQFGIHHLAIPFYEKAISMNSLEPNIRTALADSYLFTGDVGKAVEQYDAAYLVAPDTRFLRSWNLMMGLAYFDRLNEAERMRSRLIERYKMPANAYNAVRVLVIAKRGPREAALKEMALMQNFVAKALCYAVLGMKKECVAELGKTADDQNFYLFLQHYPAFKDLQSDPDFQKLLVKQKLLHADRTKKWGQYYGDFAMN